MASKSSFSKDLILAFFEELSGKNRHKSELIEFVTLLYIPLSDHN